MFNRIIQGDSLEQLKTLPDNLVDCCITSPPYWALRDYKVEGQLGLEPTFDEYLTKLVDVFDQIKRVLKKTGSCWVVMGDTYAGTCSKGTNGTFRDPKYRNGRNSQDSTVVNNRVEGIQDKSLCLIPDRFAIAMLDHGWILRNKIIWHKPNCMPSSAKDRFTVDFETVFFFVKSPKYYFETQYESFIKRDLVIWPKFGGNKGSDGMNRIYSCERRLINSKGRIKRAVWKISTKPYSEAHFAVFPEQLIETPIKAGCPPDGLVLDPFMGAGTTALVALKNVRKFLGIELNPDYIELANKRIEPFLKQSTLCLNKSYHSHPLTFD